MPRYFQALFFALLLAVSATPSTASAAELNGVEMPDSVTVDGIPLILNGMGLRLATLLKIKVYVLGFYLQQADTDAAAILASDQRKRIVMHFLRGVDSEDLKDAWQEGYANNSADLQSMAAQIERFKSSMSDIGKGQEMVIDFGPDGVKVSIQGTQVVSIEGQDFARATLAIWQEPPNKELKAGMLGAS